MMPHNMTPILPVCRGGGTDWRIQFNYTGEDKIHGRNGRYKQTDWTVLVVRTCTRVITPTNSNLPRALQGAGLRVVSSFLAVGWMVKAPFNDHVT
jgi:hypothetical protein